MIFIAEDICARHLFLFLLTFWEPRCTVAEFRYTYSEIRESGKHVRELELVAYTFLSEIARAISFALCAILSQGTQGR